LIDIGGQTVEIGADAVDPSCPQNLCRGQPSEVCSRSVEPTQTLVAAGKEFPKLQPECQQRIEPLQSPLPRHHPLVPARHGASTHSEDGSKNVVAQLKVALKLF
jgi:hypothetical protein